jgi:ribosomal protein L31
MKAGIHPAYEAVNVVCACGNTFKTRSTAIRSLPVARSWWTPKAVWTGSKSKCKNRRICRKSVRSSPPPASADLVSQDLGYFFR